MLSSHKPAEAWYYPDRFSLVECRTPVPDGMIEQYRNALQPRDVWQDQADHDFYHSVWLEIGAPMLGSNNGWAIWEIMLERCLVLARSAL